MCALSELFVSGESLFCQQRRVRGLRVWHTDGLRAVTHVGGREVEARGLGSEAKVAEAGLWAEGVWL